MLRRNRWFGLLAGLGALVVTVAACGGGGGTQAPAQVSPSGESTGTLEPNPTPSEGTVLLEQKEAPAEEAPRVGKLAPSFTLPTPDGTSLSLADYRGRPVVVNFWATWCGPCKVEMPHLQSVYQELSPQGLAIVAVNLDESRGAVVDYFQDLGLTFPTVLDKGLKVAQGKYGVFGLPTTFFVDRDGTVRFIKIGPFTTRQSLRNTVQQHLGL